LGFFADHTVVMGGVDGETVDTAAGIVVGKTSTSAA
jgi:hypothetical protein